MRIALFGQADFGKECLDRLIAGGHQVVGVFVPPDGSRPDALGARGDELGLPVVRRKFYRKRTGEPIPAALEAYREVRADLNVLASVTVFLPHEITHAPLHKSICFHPSLLPRFRGGSAMQWQIILGEKETGVTIFVPDRGTDTGSIVVQRGGVTIAPDDTTTSLFFNKLQPLGIEAMVEAVNRIADGSAKIEPQDELRATSHPLVDDKIAVLNLGYDAATIDRLVRGCDPNPGAFLLHQGKKLRLFGARLEEGPKGKPGTILSCGDDGMLLALKDGALRVTRVRAELGKESAAAFVERAGLKVGERFQSGCA